MCPVIVWVLVPLGLAPKPENFRFFPPPSRCLPGCCEAGLTPHMGPDSPGALRALSIALCGWVLKCTGWGAGGWMGPGFTTESLVKGTRSRVEVLLIWNSLR